jgi:chitinase
MTDYDEADDARFNTEGTLRYWVESGADPKKLIVGMPMYGQSFTLQTPTNNGLNAPSRGGGDKGEFTRAKGFLAFNEVNSDSCNPLDLLILTI